MLGRVGSAFLGTNPVLLTQEVVDINQSVRMNFNSTSKGDVILSV